MTLLFTSRSRPVPRAGPAPAFWAKYKISPLSVLSFANCAPALGRGIGQAPIIAAYRRALPLLGRINNLLSIGMDFCRAALFRLDIIALPFGQAWGQIPIPAGRCRGKRKPPPTFCGMPHIFRLHQSRSRPGAGLLQGAGHCSGRAPQAFRPAGETDGEAVEPAPLRGGGLPAAPPGGSARAWGHSPSRSNRKSCGFVILRREQYPIRCGSTTVSSSPCRFLSAHK